ncbi:Uncharacterised protein [Salmonella enterica subsp. enterica]|uniref:Uncharacterized protein n=1 Tax=Salmonella enterica I TaxID=59201 RepID=A0A380CD69_SALET|nr:Uncharacterised protein [Salmonella enterica subsp. enterica]
MKKTTTTLDDDSRRTAVRLHRPQGTSPAGDIHGRYRANRHNGQPTQSAWRKNTEAFLMSAIRTCLPVLRGVFHAVHFLMTA